MGLLTVTLITWCWLFLELVTDDYFAKMDFRDIARPPLVLSYYVVFVTIKVRDLTAVPKYRKLAHEKYLLYYNNVVPGV